MWKEAVFGATRQYDLRDDPFGLFGVPKVEADAETVTIQPLALVVPAFLAVVGEASRRREPLQPLWDRLRDPRLLVVVAGTEHAYGVDHGRVREALLVEEAWQHRARPKDGFTFGWKARELARLFDEPGVPEALTFHGRWTCFEETRENGAYRARLCEIVRSACPTPVLVAARRR